MNGLDNKEKYKIRKEIEELADRLDKIEELFHKIEYMKQEVIEYLSLLEKYRELTRRKMEENTLKYGAQGDLNEEDMKFLEKFKKRYNLESQDYSVEVA